MSPSIACTANGGRGRGKKVKLPGSQDMILNSTHFKKNKYSFTSISTLEFLVLGSNNEHANWNFIPYAPCLCSFTYIWTG